MNVFHYIIGILEIVNIMFNIVATPIGNLKDLSIRQAETIASSDYLLCEDTRTVQNLILTVKNKFNIKINQKQEIISFYKEKEYTESFRIIEILKNNKIVSLVSESGTPIISDPGLFILQQVIKNNIPYSVIPGTTALITALVYSGFENKKFMYLGFLPKKENEIMKLIDNIKSVVKIIPKISFVFYDSNHRINKTLEILDKYIPNANICICREMTKKFEEIIRGKPKSLMNRKYKGEITIVLSI